jgi:hypothetical protein
MIGVRTLGVVAATLCATAVRAQASCPIALDGDGAAVDDVRAALRPFGEGEPPCVALWVRCRRTGTQLEIDLHDELGRSSLHLFASAGGAAAFLISWSRRPLPVHGPDAPPGLDEPRLRPSPAATPAAIAPSDRDWHAETSVACAFSTGLHTPWGTATTLVMKDAGMWRYGGGGLVIVGSSGRSVSVGIEAAVGVQANLRPRLTLVGEVFVGDAILARSVGFAAESDYGAAGLRAGIRAGLAWQFTGAFGVGLEWGYDLVQSDLDPSATTGVASLWGRPIPSHVALALRWLP